MSFKPQFSDAGTGETMVATGPKYFADQLTLFRPGEDKLSPTITTAPPNFQIFSPSGITAIRYAKVQLF